MKTKETTENGFKGTEIGLIPKDWNIVRLEEVSKKLKAGGTPRTNIKEYWDGDISLVKVEDVASSEKYLTKTLFSITKEGLKSSSAWIVPKDSVLLSMYGTAGEVVINRIPVAVTQNILGIIKNDKITTEFLYYALTFSKNYGMSKITDKTIFKYFTLAKAKGLPFSLPPLSEQQRISFVLSKIQQAIEQQNKIIQTAKELKKSLINKLFTEGLHGEEQKETEIGLIPKSWEVKVVDNIVEKTKQIDPKRKSNLTFKYIDVSGISNESFRITEHKIYNNSNAPSRARKLVQTDDVIFATVRPTLKRIAYIDEVYNGEICSTAFCVLRSKTSILLSRFLYYYVQRDAFIEELAKLQRGASYPAVTDSDIKKQKIPLPNLDEQQEIADILLNIDKKLTQAESRKQTLQSLFKTMLNQLMTGRTRVKNLDIEVN